MPVYMTGGGSTNLGGQSSAAPTSAIGAGGLLRQGMSGSTVRALQQALTSAGYNPGGTDGVYGPNTANAVRAYQKANGLSVDGIAGAQTLGHLTSSHPSTVSAPKPVLPHAVISDANPGEGYNVTGGGYHSTAPSVGRGVWAPGVQQSNGSILPTSLPGIGAQTGPAIPPAGTYVGQGSSADVGAGDKVYQVGANGGYDNNVYNAQGQKIASYFHASQTPTAVYHPGAVAPTPGGVGANTLGVQIPKPNGQGLLPISTGSGTSSPEAKLPNPTNPTPTNAPTPKSVAPSAPAPTNYNLPSNSTGTGKKSPAPNGAPVTAPPVTAPSVPSMPVTGAPAGNSNQMDPYIQSLLNSWQGLMGTNLSTDPVLAQEAQSEASLLNDQYFQKWITARDKLGNSGLGNSGFLNDTNTRLMLGKQDAMQQAYGKLLSDRQTQLINQANAYMNMVKTEQPYSQMTADQQSTIANAQAALQEKWAQAQLPYQQLTAAQQATLSGQMPNGSPTLDYLKYLTPYQQLTADQQATLSGQLPGGSPTLDAQKAAQTAWYQQQQILNDQAKTAVSQGQLQLAQQYDSARIAQASQTITNTETRDAVLSYGTQMSNALSTMSKITTADTAAGRDPTQDTNYKAAYQAYLTASQKADNAMSGYVTSSTSGN